MSLDAESVEPHLLKDLVGYSATVTTICQFLSGMFTVHKIVVKQGGVVGDLSVVPFLMGAVGCFFWLLYGYLRNDAMVVNCNIVGTLLNAFYCLVFVKYTVLKTLIYRQVSGALIFSTAVVIYVSNGLEKKDNVGDDSPLMHQVGMLCVVVGLLGCASPLVALKDVLRTKSTETLPFPLIFSMFLVCAQWWVYGILANDPVMQFTNFLGTCIALLQLGLFGIYSSGKPHSGYEYKKVSNNI